MTESLLTKLEEKMMALLAELEDARSDIQRLAHENAALKHEKELHSKKISDILSLLDTVNESEIIPNHHGHVTAIKPALVQG